MMIIKLLCSKTNQSKPHWRGSTLPNNTLSLCGVVRRSGKDRDAGAFCYRGLPAGMEKRPTCRANLSGPGCCAASPPVGRAVNPGSATRLRKHLSFFSAVPNRRAGPEAGAAGAVRRCQRNRPFEPGSHNQNIAVQAALNASSATHAGSVVMARTKNRSTDGNAMNGQPTPALRICRR